MKKNKLNGKFKTLQQIMQKVWEPRHQDMKKKVRNQAAKPAVVRVLIALTAGVISFGCWHYANDYDSRYNMTVLSTDQNAADYLLHTENTVSLEDSYTSDYQAEQSEDTNYIIAQINSGSQAGKEVVMSIPSDQTVQVGEIISYYKSSTDHYSFKSADVHPHDQKLIAICYAVSVFALAWSIINTLQAYRLARLSSSLLHENWDDVNPRISRPGQYFAIMFLACLLMAPHAVGISWALETQSTSYHVGHVTAAGRETVEYPLLEMNSTRVELGKPFDNFRYDFDEEGNMGTYLRYYTEFTTTDGEFVREYVDRDTCLYFNTLKEQNWCPDSLYLVSDSSLGGLDITAPMHDAEEPHSSSSFGTGMVAAFVIFGLMAAAIVYTDSHIISNNDQYKELVGKYLHTTLAGYDVFDELDMMEYYTDSYQNEIDILVGVIEGKYDIQKLTSLNDAYQYCFEYSKDSNKQDLAAAREEYELEQTKQRIIDSSTKDCIIRNNDSLATIVQKLNALNDLIPENNEISRALAVLEETVNRIDINPDLDRSNNHAIDHTCQALFAQLSGLLLKFVSLCKYYEIEPGTKFATKDSKLLCRSQAINTSETALLELIDLTNRKLQEAESMELQMQSMDIISTANALQGVYGDGPQLPGGAA